MPNPTLPIIAPTAPEGFCETLGPEWINQILGLMNGAVAVFEGVGTVILNQEDQPGVDQRDLLWRRPSMGNLIFQYISGAWICPNPEPAGGPVRRLYVGDLASLQTYDGGDTGAPGTNSGPMWEEATEFQGRSPMGPGALPGDATSKVLALGEGYGEGTHKQTAAEVGVHTHDVPVVQASATGGPQNDYWVDKNALASNRQTDANAGGTAMNITHPVYGVYVIKRTALRVNYVLT